MKRWLRFTALFLAVCLALGSVTALADGLWSDEYYRAADTSGDLTEAEQEDLDEYCLRIMQAHQLDLALVSVTDLETDGDPLEELAAGYYDACDFGYGDDREGFIGAYNCDTEEFVFLPMGAAAEAAIPEDFRAFICERAPGYFEEYGVYGVLYSCARFTDNYLNDHRATDPEEVGIPEPSRGNMPAWYPADVNAFVPFHTAETTPRVVDDADIFTAAEEQRMEARLREIRSELGKDIVVFTDMSTYGLSRAVYAADFYDFNGYGIGPEYEGVCLMICMEEGNRGWWCCCTGTETRTLYTEESANAIDDVLYEYMAGGEYAAGVSDWIENIRTMYVKGMPFAPEWMPDEGEAFVRTNNTAVPRVVDETGTLTDAELGLLTDKAAQLSLQYGVDVAVVVDRYIVGMTSQEYSDGYYYYNGLGYGDGFDGILLTALKDGGEYICRITAEGEGKKNLTDVNLERLTVQCSNTMEEGKVYAGIDRWLTQVGGMYRTGRVPRTAGEWSFTAIWEAIAGAAVGFAAWLRARLGMQTPKTKTDANAYLLPNSLRVIPRGDWYIGTTTSRRYDPVQRSSSGGGGGSSYSGGYHGSSGRSHSGSGRSF